MMYHTTKPACWQDKQDNKINAPLFGELSRLLIDHKQKDPFYIIDNHRADPIYYPSRSTLPQSQKIR